ncbi:hypothetical protein [Symmachiella dynata]|uniref:hypothetical protein n=1 Tax=Symmachiella dynata TaxID=2527995 RepID=UPI0030ED5265|tara:strand:- start:357 stop:794 length:438 start_codon:yes stop_codon:yes gene_type:complete
MHPATLMALLLFTVVGCGDTGNDSRRYSSDSPSVHRDGNQRDNTPVETQLVDDAAIDRVDPPRPVAPRRMERTKERTVTRSSERRVERSRAPPHDETVDSPQAFSHWLNTSSSVRHNSSCRWFNNTKRGRMCGPNEGRGCKICGG